MSETTAHKPFDIMASMQTCHQLFFACPHCGSDHAFEVTHFLNDGVDRDFGAWSCKDCRWRITGRWHHAAQNVSITAVEEPDTVAGFVLLRIAPTVPGKTVRIVLEHAAYMSGLDPDDPNDLDNRLRFLFEEHSCPTNFLRIPAIICDGDMDPHGVLQFEAFVPRPSSWTEADEDQDNWAELFPQLIEEGPEIEGYAEGRLLSAPRVENNDANS